jgi:hypothetical protein
VVVEAQFQDSNGQPTRHYLHILGRMDKAPWSTQAIAGADGKVVAYLPHGLENVQLRLMTDERAALRWRKTKDGPLNNSYQIPLGTVTDDVTGIEVVRYAAPILIVKVSAKDGQDLKDPGVTAAYGEGKGQFPGRFIVAGGRKSDVSFERQEDGRFRSSQLFPDEDVTITAHADGYASRSVPVKLPEGETKEIAIALEKAPTKKNDEKK